jgi:catechol 2,3-dioxygenase-like lactoylglutathione lyase family enzyme
MSIHPQTRMGPVRLKVADAERMLAFYQEVMGLAVLGEVDGAMALGVGEMPLIELMAQPGARRVGGVTGLFHVALLVPSARDLGTWLAHLKQAGAGRLRALLGPRGEQGALSERSGGQWHRSVLRPRARAVALCRWAFADGDQATRFGAFAGAG